MKVRLLLTMVVGCLVSNAFGIIGLGGHWTLDYSVKMDDVDREHVVFDSLSIKVDPSMGTAPAGFTSLTSLDGSILPIYVSRENMRPMIGNFGIKFYFDGFPFIDIIEASGNFGAWEYDGKVIYPDSIKFRNSTPYSSADEVTNPDSLFAPVYDTFDLHLSKFRGTNLIGVSKTPYARMRFDFALKKTVYKPPIWEKAIRLYVGTGASMHIATPLLEASLLKKVLGDSLKNQSGDFLAKKFSNDSTFTKVVEKMASSFSKPSWGMHVSSGAWLRFPGNLLGIYFEGKYLIPFETAQKGISVKGLLFQLGMTAGF